MEPQFIDEPQVPVNGLQHRIDQDGFFGLNIGQQVGVGAAFRLKQLNTDNMGPSQESEWQQRILVNTFFT